MTARGVSMVLGPTGESIGDVIRDSEGLLYADIDVAACVEPKQFHDVVGYYNRFDIFKLTVDRSANRPITFEVGEQRSAASMRQLPRGHSSPYPAVLHCRRTGDDAAQRYGARRLTSQCAVPGKARKRHQCTRASH